MAKATAQPPRELGSGRLRPHWIARKHAPAEGAEAFEPANAETYPPTHHTSHPPG